MKTVLTIAGCNGGAGFQTNLYKMTRNDVCNICTEWRGLPKEILSACLLPVYFILYTAGANYTLVTVTGQMNLKGEKEE